MKKLLLLLITLTTFTNVSYASFPVDTNKTDTTKVVAQETTEQYHLRIEKQGFDIESCVCESCRDGKTVIYNNSSFSNDASFLFLLGGVLSVVLIRWAITSFLCFLRISSSCTGDAPLFLMTLLGFFIIFLFVIGWLKQENTKYY